MANVIRAMMMYGVHGTVRVHRMQNNRMFVELNGKYFGVWDAERNTFVD